MWAEVHHDGWTQLNSWVMLLEKLIWKPIYKHWQCEEERLWQVCSSAAILCFQKNVWCSWQSSDSQRRRQLGHQTASFPTLLTVSNSSSGRNEVPFDDRGSRVVPNNTHGEVGRATTQYSPENQRIHTNLTSSRPTSKPLLGAFFNQA